MRAGRGGGEVFPDAEDPLAVSDAESSASSDDGFVRADEVPTPSTSARRAANFGGLVLGCIEAKFCK